MFDIIETLVDIIETILVLIAIAIIGFCAYRFFTMNTIDMVTFEFARATNGAAGVINWFVNDIANAISTIL